MLGLEIVGAVGRHSPSAFLPGREANKNILCDKDWKEQRRSERWFEMQAGRWEEILPWSQKAAPDCLCPHGSEALALQWGCLLGGTNLGSCNRTGFLSLLPPRTHHLLLSPPVVVPLASAAKVCRPGASLERHQCLLARLHRRLWRGPDSTQPLLL